MKRFKFLKNKYNAQLLIDIKHLKNYILKKNERCSKNIHTFAP